MGWVLADPSHLGMLGLYAVGRCLLLLAVVDSFLGCFGLTLAQLVIQLRCLSVRELSSLDLFLRGDNDTSTES